MRWRMQVGSTSFSTPRTSSEYGGCSHTNRSRPRRSATHLASTIWLAGEVHEPLERDFPARTRAGNAPGVSSTAVSASGGGSLEGVGQLGLERGEAVSAAP